VELGRVLRAGEHVDVLEHVGDAQLFEHPHDVGRAAEGVVIEDDGVRVGHAVDASARL
jgi:hypothetical protein